MSDSYNSWSKEWDKLGLDKLLHKEEMQYVNQREDYCDSLKGEWFVIPKGFTNDGRKAIIYGTFGNYQSPGSDPRAEVYDMSDPDDEEDFLAACRYWEGLPEYHADYYESIGETGEDVEWEEEEIEDNEDITE